MNNELSRNVADMTGMKFNRWTVVSFAGRGGRRENRWNCVCDCGKTQIIKTYHLTAAKSKSCGCLRDEVATVHGLCRSSENNIWRRMKDRCSNPNNPSYARYGGRGIKVCDRWSGPDAFPAFYADMGPRPTPQHSIERKDSEGDYTPENCKWATPKEQAENRSTTTFYTHEGVTRSCTDWAKHLRMPLSTLKNRLYRGWSFADSIARPVLRKNPSPGRWGPTSP